MFHTRAHMHHISKLLTKFGIFLKLTVFKINIILFHPMCPFPQRCIKPIVPKYLLHRKIDSNQAETFLQTTREWENKNRKHTKNQHRTHRIKLTNLCLTRISWTILTNLRCVKQTTTLHRHPAKRTCQKCLQCR